LSPNVTYSMQICANFSKAEIITVTIAGADFA